MFDPKVLRMLNLEAQLAPRNAATLQCQPCAADDPAVGSYGGTSHHHNAASAIDAAKQQLHALSLDIHSNPGK